MTKTKPLKKTFIFSEKLTEYPTMIHPNYFVIIPGQGLYEYYRVLDESKRAGTQRPQPFMLQEERKSTCGWKFDAQEINNKELIKALEEKKIACLVLNPKLVEEVSDKENQTK